MLYEASGFDFSAPIAVTASEANTNDAIKFLIISQIDVSCTELRLIKYCSGIGVPGMGLSVRSELLPIAPNYAIISVCLTFLGISRKGHRVTVLMIRLSRRGAKKQPYYRVVVIEKDRARDGRSVEVVGTYNPRTNPASLELKRDRIDYWRSKGAQLSERVAKLVEKAPASTPAA